MAFIALHFSLVPGSGRVCCAHDSPHVRGGRAGLPTSLVVAPRSEESDQYLLVLSENCVPWSFIGIPAISVPCGLTAGEQLPVGLELVTGPFRDGVLLALGSAVESALGMPVLPSFQ